MPAGELVGHLERYAAVVATPLVLGDEVRARVRCTAAGYRVATDRRHLARAARRDRHRAARDARRARRAGAARPGHPAHGRRGVPQPRRSCRPAASSSSAPRPPGAQIADELARAGRARGPGRRPAHPDAAALPRDGHLLVARARPAGWPAPSTSVRDAARRPPRAVAAARRAQPSDPRGTDVDLATLQAAGVRAGRSAGRASTVVGSTFARRPGRHHVAAADRRHAPLPRRRRPATSTRAGPDRARSTPRVRPEPRAVRARSRRGWTCAPRASAPCCWPPASGRTTRGCGCRSSAPDGAIQQHRGVTPAPGLYVVGQRVPAPARLDVHRRRPVRRPRRGRPPVLAAAAGRATLLEEAS